MGRVTMILAVSAVAFAGCANQQGGDAGQSPQDKLAKFRINTLATTTGMTQNDIEKMFGLAARTVDTDSMQLLSRLRAAYVLVFDNPADVDVKFVVGFNKGKAVTDFAIWKTTEGGLASFGKLVRPVDYWTNDSK